MVEEGFIKAINAIEAAIGRKPKRIEMENGTHIIKFHGVELLVSSTTWGYFFLRNQMYSNVVVSPTELEPT